MDWSARYGFGSSRSTIGLPNFLQRSYYLDPLLQCARVTGPHHHDRLAVHLRGQERQRWRDPERTPGGLKSSRTRYRRGAAAWAPKPRDSPPHNALARLNANEYRPRGGDPDYSVPRCVSDNKGQNMSDAGTLGLGSMDPESFSLIRVERELVARAFRDESFRRRWLDDPRSVLERELGPLGDCDVFVHEEKPGVIHLIVPAASAGSAPSGQPLLAKLEGGRGTRNGEEDTARSLADKDLTRDAIEDEVVRRSRTDSGFRQDLLSDPRGALGRHFDINLPNDWEVNVHEERPGELHFLLPRDPAAEGDAREQLTDERVKALAFSCVDMCYTASATACGTCTLVTYCWQ